jgi:penicillin-binding protein 2
MVSRPTFDPNSFAVRISSKEWNSLITDPAKPLLNKAIQAQLAPGSVFKIIMSVAGWQEGISQTLAIHCGGGASFYGRFFKCWEKRGHGGVTLPKAIYQSCDVYFYTLAERLGIGRMAAYSQRFGLGQKSGIDLPQEVSGVFPSEEWKIRNFKQKWYAGETISVGIGQGAVATTPVQLMRAVGAITSGGRLVTPHVAFPDELPPQYVQVNHYAEVKQVDIDPQGWETITDAMAEVVNPIGTAPSAHLKDIDFAGKTGSAQTISNQAKARLGGDKSRFRDNGWFVGVTPRRNPEIVVAVLVEQGEHGYLAARVAAQVVKAYVDKKKKIPISVASAAALDSDKTPDTEATEAPLVEGPKLPATKPGSQAIEMTGVGKPGDQADGHLTGGTFKVPTDGKKKPAAIAAPGMEANAAKKPTTPAKAGGSAESPALKPKAPTKPATTPQPIAERIEPKSQAAEAQR